MEHALIFVTSGTDALKTRDQWLPILQAAIDDTDGRWTTEQLLADIKANSVLVWMVEKGGDVLGVFTVRVIQGRDRWVLVEDLAGTRINQWLLEASQALDHWAREIGARQIVFEGRRGWQKMLAPLGYDVKRVTGVKKLEVLQ